MEYCIYPLRPINISQRYSSSHCAWDICGPTDELQEWYAPCTVKVLKIYPRNKQTQTGSYNTVLFGSCNANGEQAAVMCEDGVARVLTFACTHMNDITNYGLAEGNIYSAGTPCYKEGDLGGQDLRGAHVHMEVATGWQYYKHDYNGQHLVDNYFHPSDIFYQLSGFNTLVSGNGYTFQTVTSRTVSSDFTITGYLLKTTNLKVAIRNSPVGSTVLTRIPVGSSGAILGFLSGFQSDGYQWARVKYGATIGYCQLDTHSAYTIGCPDAALDNNPLYIVNNSTSRTPAVRNSIGGSLYATVAANTPYRVKELIPGFQSDGYQWVKIDYNGEDKYVQLDLYNWLYLKIN